MTGQWPGLILSGTGQSFLAANHRDVRFSTAPGPINSQECGVACCAALCCETNQFVIQDDIRLSDLDGGLRAKGLEKYMRPIVAIVL